MLIENILCVRLRFCEVTVGLLNLKSDIMLWCLKIKNRGTKWKFFNKQMEKIQKYIKKKEQKRQILLKEGGANVQNLLQSMDIRKMHA